MSEDDDGPNFSGEVWAVVVLAVLAALLAWITWLAWHT